MKRFAQLFAQLDQTNKTNAKVALLKAYFLAAPDTDKVWVLALFSHKRPRRQVKTTAMRQWAYEVAGIPSWFFEETYHIVGDLAETIALILPPPISENSRSLAGWMEFIKEIGGKDDGEQKQAVLAAWQTMAPQERFLFTKLMTGGFRIGISQNLVIRAVAEAFGLEKTVAAHRLMGNWEPAHTSFQELLLEESPAEDASRPYPFCLAHPLDEVEMAGLGDPKGWMAEWKWDGIRGQVIARAGGLYVWSRGEELVTDKFPEFEGFAQMLPDGTVLDGEILCYRDGQPLPFGELQTRIGRKNVTKKVRDNAPVVFMAYDLVEREGEDIRQQPLARRRALLEELGATMDAHPHFLLSPQVHFDSWDTLAEVRQLSRDHFAEGLMLKNKGSAYHVGRKRGDWWKWKIDPLTIDGVLIYAQKGHGRRAGLFTDYTFGVWHEGQLVVFAKAYSGLTDQEFREVDAFIKQNTVERFGPVRTVKPELVFEIGFEGIRKSGRHKSGVALRFPRMLRWRKDKKAEEADTLENLQALINY